MKLREVCDLIDSKEVMLSIEGVLKHKLFTRSYENNLPPIVQACAEYGEREITCIYPTGLAEVCLVIK